MTHTSLVKTLRVNKNPCLAFVGAGGKTTAIFALASELAAGDGHPGVFVTTTTHLAVEQARLADIHIVVSPNELLAPSKGSGIILVTAPGGDDGRLAAISPQQMLMLKQIAATRGMALLIEADGSRMKAIKAPAAHEPAIPDFVEGVVVLAGMQALGKTLDGDHVHRFERFGELCGLRPGEAVTPAAMTGVLLHSDGGLKNIPNGARKVVLLNQADTPQLQAMANGMARPLLDRYDGVLVTRLQGVLDADSQNQPQILARHERIAGVVLAAGGGARFGAPKQLLPWRGWPLVWHAARAALDAGLDPVLVVCGEQQAAIESVLQGLAVRVVGNPAWQEGQSASLQAGLAAISGHVGGAIFLLADQPQVPVGLIRGLVEAHASQPGAIFAPLVDGQRGNPVLFDASVFPDLMALRGDVGGRLLFARYPVEWLPWHDRLPLLDVDTPQDYAKLQALE